MQYTFDSKTVIIGIFANFLFKYKEKTGFVIQYSYLKKQNIFCIHFYLSMNKCIFKEG